MLYLPNILKRCSNRKCREPLLPANKLNFTKWKYGADGLCDWCKHCKNEAARRRRESNPDTLREERRRYRSKHHDDLRSKLNEWRKNNPAAVRKQTKRRRAAYRVEMNARTAAWRERNQMAVQVYGRQYKRANRERANALMRIWREANRDRVNNCHQRRRARMRGLLSTLTAQDWQNCLARFDHRCAYCGRGGKLQIDHFIPISDSRATHAAGNVLPACPSCNSSKRDTDPAVWLNRRFGKRRAAAILARINAYFESLNTSEVKAS